MINEFLHYFGRLRNQIVGWSIGAALYGLMMAYLWPSIKDLGDIIGQFIDMFPDIMVAMFENITMLATPKGYIDVYYFSYMHLMIAIFAISAGVGMLVSDEEKGFLDIVLAHPILRIRLFISRFLAISSGLIIILIAGWMSWAVPAGSIDLGISPVELSWPFISMFALLIFFTSFGVMLSMWLPSARNAGSVMAALLMGNYLFKIMTNIDTDLRPWLRFTPLGYYQAGNAIDGLNLGWTIGLLGVSFLLLLIGLQLFQKRDIRVSGEHGWKLFRWRR
jgi:ABC-2 type transport system permease protein